jgi:sugar lactone lactonase YvrE
VAILLVAGTAAVLWSRRPRQPAPLEARWEATVAVLAGDGVAGWRDGDADRARFGEPFGVAVAPGGTVYIADAGESHRLRAVSPDGAVATLAGGRRGAADGQGGAAAFDTPSGLAVDSQGTIYLADTGNHTIRRITPDGRVTTLAGDGTAGYRDGPAAGARFNGPIGVALDRTGRLIVADSYNDRIRAIDAAGVVSTIAGGPAPGLVDGPGADARFQTPCGVAVDSTGRIYVADTGNGVMRSIDPAGGVTTTVWAFPEGLGRPLGVAVAGDGEVVVADERGRISAITPDGWVRTLAGGMPGFRDGPGREARFRRPSGVAIAGAGRLVVADAGNALVRLVAARSDPGLRLPTSPRIAPGFDADAFARLPVLWPIAPMDGPHEIAGTLGEARGGEGTERFHAGIDIRADDGLPVLAVRDGTVASPVAAADFGTLNESLRIGAVAYVHIRAGRTRRGGELDPSKFVAARDESGRLVGMRVRRGARFRTGDVVATVNAFNHVHLNVGWPGEEYNPLLFRLAGFEDSVAPTIARGGVRLVGGDGGPLVERIRGRLVVDGRVRIVVDAWDQADGNRPGRRLGVYALGYEVLARDGTPVQPGGREPAMRIRFDRLGGDPNAARLVYAPGSGIPFYGRRVTRFLYAVTNTFRNGVGAEGVWDTTQLPPGDYTVRVYAADIRGNMAVANRDLPVRVVAPAN